MQEQRAAAPASGGASGTTCTKTGLYKATDGRMEFVEFVRKGQAFPKYPGGTGTSNTTWQPVTATADGDRTGFAAVKVAAGSQ